MNKKGPTKKQAALLHFIAEYSEAHDTSPTYREIMHAMQLRSVSAVAEHIANCEKAGFLEKVPGQARSLRVIPPETHDETVNFFNQKLAALTNELQDVTDKIALAIAPDPKNTPDGSPEPAGEPGTPQDNYGYLAEQRSRLEEQIHVLEYAAQILEIDL